MAKEDELEAEEEEEEEYAEDEPSREDGEGEPEGEDLGPEGTGNADDDDDDEEEEGPDEYEKDGWMVDEEEEEDRRDRRRRRDEEEEEEEEEEGEGNEEEDKAEKKKKKKKKREEELELDDDDYELLEEAGVHGVKKKEKKFKRLKKRARTEFGGEEGFFDGGDEHPEGDEQRVARDLFGEEDVAEDEFIDRDQDDMERGIPGEEEGMEGEYYEEDEMGDFIVEGEEGQHVRRRRTGVHAMPGVTSEALLEAQDIFGDVSELIEKRQMALEKKKREEEREKMERGEGGEGGEYGDMEGSVPGMGIPGGVLASQYEPSLLEEKYMTHRDNAIRETDAPERLQLLEETVGLIPEEDDDIAKEAEWVFDRAFGMKAPPTTPDRERFEFRKHRAAEMEIKEINAKYPKDLAAISPEDRRRKEQLQQESDEVRQEGVQQIANVLRELHRTKVEVPYIGMHLPGLCKNICPPESLDGVTDRPELHTYSALWVVQQWDKKYLMLQRRKRSLQAVYERPRASEEQESLRSRPGFLEGVLQTLDQAQTEYEVDDVDAKFNLQFPAEELGDNEDGGGARGARHHPKRVRKRSLYVACTSAGLKELVRCLGLTAYKLGENLKYHLGENLFKQFEVTDELQAPEEAAEALLSSQFPTTERVLAGARHIAEVEIGTEPGVRHCLRSVFMEKAEVSTEPTPRGKSEIGAFHRYSGVEWLRNKPLASFVDDQWLLIAKAEREGLLKVTVAMPQPDIDSIMQHLEASYLSEGVSRAAQLWNEHRKMVLQTALHKRLLPHMANEARNTLAARARAYVAESCAEGLRNIVSVAPFDLNEKQGGASEDDDQDQAASRGPRLRVLACCWGPGKPATTFAMLDASGELVDFLHTGFITARASGDNQQTLRAKKEEDVERLRQFLIDHKPHIVVLGASNMACRHLYDEIFETICTIVERHPMELPPEVGNIMVQYEDETAACLYENSRISSEQLPGRPGIVRRAVGLGRYSQNRLAMMASLFGPKREILALKLHPSQDLVGEEELYDALERTMVTVTNQVGVDVNLAISQEWLFAPLQFVAGLGPRKAASLRAQMVASTAVRRRRELAEEPFFLGPVVFLNAATGLRLRAQEDVLDDTRIHPADYRLALQVAMDAYCDYQEQEGEGKMTPQEVEERGTDVVVEARYNPKIISQLGPYDYAKRLAEDGLEESAVLKLPLILRELMQGYAECREKVRELTQDEQFRLLTGESDETLAEGRVVGARVRKATPMRVQCELESGLMGVVDRSDFSDDPEADIMTTVREGTMLTCRVKLVQKSKYLVELTCRGSDLRSTSWLRQRNWDRYFDVDAAVDMEERQRSGKSADSKTSASAKAVAAAARPSFKPRMITHPLFANISMKDAIEKLKSREVGDVIIRPSSRGPSNLSITMKLYDDICFHVDIAETGKDKKDLTSFLRLGKTLTIGDDTFEDLDEVMARFVEPVAGYLRELVAYRKFRGGTKADVDSVLREEKQRDSRRIPYYISPSYEHPGVFRLSYIRTAAPKHEYLSVSPQGFRFRQQDFPTADHLVRYFQKHVNDDVTQARQRGAMAASAAAAAAASALQVSANISSRSHSTQPGAPSSRGGWDVQPVTAGTGVGATAGSGRSAAASWAPQIVHVSSTPVPAGMTWSGGQWRTEPGPRGGAGAGGAYGGGGREYSGAPAAYPAAGQPRAQRWDAGGPGGSGMPAGGAGGGAAGGQGQARGAPQAGWGQGSWSSGPGKQGGGEGQPGWPVPATGRTYSNNQPQWQ